MGQSIRSILMKFPSFAQIAPVYSLIVTLVYGWGLLHFFWKIPGLVFYSPATDTIAIFAYMTVVNVLESLAVLAWPVILSLILPQTWFRDRFVSRGMLFSLLALICLALFDKQIQAGVPFPYALAKWAPVVAVAISALVLLLDRIPTLVKILEELGDRLTIFLYIILPLAAVSLLTVLIRNLF